MTPEPLRLGPLRATGDRGPAAVFLDRDGVLNDAVGDGSVARSPRTLADVRIAADAPSAVATLRDHGFILVVVTNQPDVGRGTLSLDDAIAITRAVAVPLELDDAFVCPHDSADNCPCRKPRPGLLVAASEIYGLDLTQSWLIGDRWVDIGAARAAGVRSVLLERPYSYDASGGQDAPDDCIPDAASPSLDEAVSSVLAGGK